MGVNAQQKINDRDKLTEEIKRLESVEYGAVKPKLPEVKLDGIEYTAPSDADLLSTAETELASYRREGEKALRDKSANSATELTEKRAALASSKDGDLAELDDKYRTASRAIDADVIKRGLARSSVAATEKSALEGEYLKRTADIVSAYGKSMSDIDAEIASLDGKLNAALNDFNLSYATKLNERLQTLKQERAARAEEILKYNNEIKKSQAKLDEDRAKAESALYSQALAQEKTENNLSTLPAERRDAIYKAVFKQMDEFLSGMSPQEAKIELLNHSLYRKHLSNYYYNRLLDKYGRFGEVESSED